MAHRLASKRLNSSYTVIKKSDLCIPRNENTQPRFQFLLSFIVSNIYIPRIVLPIWLQQNRQIDPGKI
jgi:hypothetical protein